MPRTCKLTYRINSGTETDISTLGFYLVKSDDRLTAPIRAYEVQRYPEQAAEEIYAHTSKESFDYSVTLLAFGDYDTVAASVVSFWDSLFSGTEALPLTLLNYWKGIQVTGYPLALDTQASYPVLTEYEKSAYLFSIKIHVSDPTTLSVLIS